MNFNQNTKLLTHENVSENIILSRGDELITNVLLVYLMYGGYNDIEKFCLLFCFVFVFSCTKPRISNSLPYISFHHHGWNMI